ncbi:MAG: hypothetical protein ACTMIK_12070 [Galactobacter sp.]
MRTDDFYIQVEEALSSAPWDTATTLVTKLNEELMRKLDQGALPGDDDLQTALYLARFVYREFELFATHDEEVFISDEQSRDLLKTLRRVLYRHEIVMNPPWRDLTSWGAYWKKADANGPGSWQKRRELLDQVFDPVYEKIDQVEEQAFQSELVEAVSPHGELGWPTVDSYIEQLRRRFRTAATAADYKDVGNRCVGVLEALSEVVYDPAVHCPPGLEVPPVSKTEVRIGAYIDDRLPGSTNKTLRDLVKTSGRLAHSLKHSERANRTSTGIAADAVILLANILRRLREVR